MQCKSVETSFSLLAFGLTLNFLCSLYFVSLKLKMSSDSGSDKSVTLYVQSESSHHSRVCQVDSGADDCSSTSSTIVFDDSEKNTVDSQDSIEGSKIDFGEEDFEDSDSDEECLQHKRDCYTCDKCHEEFSLRHMNFPECSKCKQVVMLCDFCYC